MPESHLRRIGESRRGGGWSEIVKAKNKPAGGPIEEIVLALDAVNVGEEAGHQDGGDQQRQRNETLIHQDGVRFPVNARDGNGLEREAQISLICHVQTHLRRPHKRTVVRRRSEGAPDTKQSTCDYGVPNFQEARVLVAKETASRGNGFSTKRLGGSRCVSEADYVP